MNYKEIIDKIRPEMDKVVDFFERELSKVRAGQVSPSLVENIVVNCFGQKMPLKQLAAISLGSARQIIIQPWDKSYLEPIEKALHQANIGGSPIVDQEVIRFSLPSLTEEYRKDLLKFISEKQEEARKTIRRWREESWGEIQEKSREGEVREDDKYRAKDELQDLVDEYNKKIEEFGEKKKKEIIG